jgi:hypothetical protein
LVLGLVVLFTSVGFAQKRQSVASARYRFTIDYFTFGNSGAFRSKERVTGDYSKTGDGAAEWSNVSIAVAHGLSALK